MYSGFMTQADDAVEDGLGLVTAFLNTVDVETGADELADPASAQAWLTGQGLLVEHASVDPAGLDVVLELRWALRALASANHAGQPDAQAAERFAAIARRLPLHAAADPSGDLRLVGGGYGAQQAAARIIGAVMSASMNGAWSRVKICPADDCLWAFVDQSKNQSRRWCAMGTCGNRHKTRAYRQRHREEAG